MKSVVIIGPAHPLRGGLASFNERLARQFMNEGKEVSIYTFSLQYPGFLFPGTTQFSSEPAPTDIDIKVRINSINLINWLKVGNEPTQNKNPMSLLSLLAAFYGASIRYYFAKSKKEQTHPHRLHSRQH